MDLSELVAREQIRHLLAAYTWAGDRGRLSELADMANTSQSRLSHRLRKLVERGDVSIADDPTDGALGVERGDDHGDRGHPASSRHSR